MREIGGYLGLDKLIPNQDRVSPCSENNVTINQIVTWEQVEGILREFNLIFGPSISSRVSSMDEYAKKLHANACIYVAELDGSRLGFVALYANDHESKTAYIPFIGVHSHTRNQGVGKKLLNRCVQKARDEGMQFIKLEVRKQNEKAKQFYQRNGFRTLSEASEESIYMIRQLDGE